jgi:hypothetical protein
MQVSYHNTRARFPRVAREDGNDEEDAYHIRPDAAPGKTAKSAARVSARSINDRVSRTSGRCQCGVRAFLTCKRYPIALKAVTFVFLVPGLGVGVYCLADYCLSFVSQNVVVEYFVTCRRLGFC